MVTRQKKHKIFENNIKNNYQITKGNKWGIEVVITNKNFIFLSFYYFFLFFLSFKILVS